MFILSLCRTGQIKRLIITLPPRYLKSITASVAFPAFAVKGATFTIHDGEFFILVGPSGCGKSTLLRCVNRMNDLIEGARVEGQGPKRGVALALAVEDVPGRRPAGPLEVLAG